MPPTSRLFRFAWVLVLLGAAGFVCWLDVHRIQRVEHVSNLAAGEAVVDANSPTGYAQARRWLIAPEHVNETYQWIIETQQMLDRGEWRIRQIDFDHAPSGRSVRHSSPFRWWLGIVAWSDHALSGRPIGLSVERAALYAPPLLHLLLLAGSTWFVARRFGGIAAALFAIAGATLLPWAGSFLPGVPSPHGLALACTLWALLPLVAANGRPRGAPVQTPKSRDEKPARNVHRLFVAAGIAGGIGLWVSERQLAPILAGIAFGASLAPWFARRRDPAGSPAGPSPWRLWALSGALTSLLAYLIEYYPAHLDFRLDANHPLLALAWVGAGEIATISGTVAMRGWRALPRSSRYVLPLAIAAVAAVPCALAWNDIFWFPAGDLFAQRLTDLPGGIFATNLEDWLIHDGFSGMFWGTFLPLLWITPALWFLFRRETEDGDRMALALVLGASLPALFLAGGQLRWWNTADSVLLALLPPVTVLVVGARSTRLRTWCWVGASVLLLVPGGVQFLEAQRSARDLELTNAEAEGLIERNLAHWLANRAGSDGVVVFAPPFRTPALCFHGGLRGVGSLDPENQDGLASALRLSRETSPEAVQSLVSAHGITHVILPSWDRTLEEFARGDDPQGESTFIAALNRWMLPNWLRPVAYQAPVIGGFEDHSVVIFEVVGEQDPVTALSRTVEYFVEMEQWEPAVAAGENLRQYSTNLGAMVARAQLEAARQETAALEATLKSIRSIVANGYDRALPWDRRVSLASVLAQTGEPDLARAQLQRCLAEVDERHLRTLSTSSLYRLHVLCRRFGLTFPSEGLRQFALQMLPPEPRQRIEHGLD